MGRGEINSFLEFRKKIYDDVRAELMGPGSEDVGPDIEHEVITDSPIERYSVGILFPQKIEIGQDEDEKYNRKDEVCDDSEKGMEDVETKIPDTESMYKDNTNERNISDNADEPDDINEQISMANQVLPSSFGMTFFVKGCSDYLKIRVKAATYRVSLYKECCVRYLGDTKVINTLLSDYVYIEGELLRLKRNINNKDVYELVQSEAIKENQELVFALYKLSSQCSDEKNKHNGYVREPLEFTNPICVDIKNKTFKKCIDEELGLELVGVKRPYGDDSWGITIMMINGKKGEKKVKNTIFQPELLIESSDNPEIIFYNVKDREDKYFDLKDDEEKSLDLLYKKKESYSVGHGVATVESIDMNGVGKIYTDFMPVYEVPKLNFSIEELKDVQEELLSMKVLSGKSIEEKEKNINNLKSLVEKYIHWIEELKRESNKFKDNIKMVANRHILDCIECSKRMEKGIEILENNENAYISFMLMNEAMLMQRLHSGVKERFPNDEDVKYPKFDYYSIENKKASWRPFQLAFILMSIEGIVSPESDDRKKVDLIWIPTGGGKTEAYLGVTSFVIFYRRLTKGENSGGTTVIMRYTLRLLAAQQFIRASILICACEKIRRQGKYNLGKEEISIGLWVGEPPTPNTNKNAKECYKNLTKVARNETDLKYKKEKYNLFQVLKCPWCGTKLEKEYVDKKLKGEWGYEYNSKKIIYCPEQECEFNYKLPIQVVDEELYKKPPTLLFGTVDKFAMIAWKEEAGDLFGVNSDNIAPELIIQDELHLISGPLGTMVGLYETAIDALCSSKGESPKIIASTATIRKASEQVKNLYNRNIAQFPPPGLYIEDSFFTREIPTEKEPGRLYVGVMPAGKTAITTQVRLMGTLLQKTNLVNAPDHIKDQYWTLAEYFNSLKELGKTSTLINDDISDFMVRLTRRLGCVGELRKIFNTKELTSRLPSSVINQTLKDLENSYGKENIDKKIYAINVLLASNMISVGVDVSRLNLMVVNGQPKLTSEYIQATSRVGRSNPGIVFTLYNGSKSRDRSHYEKFYSYHKTFYKYVEPTSVTPFSEPARERGLHAIFITMIRHLLRIGNELSAKEFNRNNIGVDKVIEFILNRVEILDTSINKRLREEVKNELEIIMEYWERKIDSAEDARELSYSKKNHIHLIKPYNSNDNEDAMETLQSMRNVDSQSKIEIIEFGGEDIGN